MEHPAQMIVHPHPMWISVIVVFGFCHTFFRSCIQLQIFLLQLKILTYHMFYINIFRFEIEPESDELTEIGFGNERSSGWNGTLRVSWTAT